MGSDPREPHLDEATAWADPRQADFLVDHARRPGRFSMDVRHYHPRHEIYYLMHGERNYFIRDRVYRVTTGQVVLIAANELHKTSALGTAGHERFLVEFAPDFLVPTVQAELPRLLSIFADPPLILSPGPAERQVLDALFARLLAESRGSGELRDLAIRVVLADLLLRLSRLGRAPAPASSQSGSTMHHTVSRITIYLNQHFAEDLGLAEIARRFSISPSYLSRSFARVTGFKFAAYLAAVRLREARRLLVDSRLSVAQVAEATGFASSTSFGRLFRAQAGVSPLRYRKLNRVFQGD